MAVIIRFAKFALLFALVGASAAWAKDKPLTTAECLACHNDSSLTKEVSGKQVSLYVKEEAYKASMHGMMFQCVDCHKDIKAFPHEPAPAKVSCGSCHGDAQKAYDAGFHAKARKEGDKNAATCADCHGSAHELLPAGDPNSRVNHANIAKTCGACHGQRFVMEGSGHSAAPFFSYQEGVHGRAVAAGSTKAAVCTDCHGAHQILSAGNPKSPIFKFNVPATCGKCHEPVQQVFMASIHGEAVERGNWQAPVCTDCHGIHLIKPHIDPTSSVAAQQLAKTTCGRCHEGVRLSQEFGIAGRRTTTYMSSYHGMASQLGSTVVANCASCHGVHNILPSSDPRSTISKAHLVETCGKCHPGATENFTKGKIHIDVPLSADIGSTAVRWVRRFYLWMIVVVIGGMLLHNFLVWRKKAVEKRHAQRRLVVRMQKAQRYQHLLLLSSFIVLVLTGFALKYPDSWFASLLLIRESTRSLVHRIAGVVLIAVSLFHLVYVMVDRNGRKLFKDLLPAPKDAWDVFGALRYYLGFSHERPQFARFHYGEKMEYWALVWGMFVMGATGLALWFKVQMGHLGPRWMLDIATAVHFYEAVLATLAIVVWHFYEVIFDPDVYPMNWAWYDGRMSIELYAEEHGADGETIAEAVAAESGNGGEPAEKHAAAAAAVPAGKWREEEHHVNVEPPRDPKKWW
jgi:cytochrome b subunit of formate dehydrogenase